MSIWDNLKRKITGPGDESAIVEGFIGRKIAELQTTHDFFKFFHFESIGVEQSYDDGDQVLAFKPSGPDFRPLVTLHSLVRPGGVIQTLRLTVARSFIDNPRTSIFAADLYNSFLRSVGHVQAGDAIDAFAHEISARAMKRAGQPILMRGQPPEPTGEPSPAYLAYAGQREAENLTYGSGRLKLVARNRRGESEHPGGEFEILVWALEENER